MILLRIKFVKKFTYVSLVVCLSLIVSFMWFKKSSENVSYDGPIKFIEKNINFQRYQPEYYMTDRQQNPVLGTFNCGKLFDGDNSELNRANEYLRNVHSFQYFKHRDYDSFRMLALNCDKYKRSRGYFAAPSSKLENEFPIAFNIIFHKNIEQFERLLRAIYRPQNQYCIHVDKKTPKDVLETMERLTGCFENVFIASKLEYIIYASYSRLKADINCMKDHINRKFEWKYLLNMAASEFPIKSNLEITQILKEFNGSNDIHEVFITMDSRRFKQKHFTYIDSKTNNSGFIIRTKKIKEDPPHNLTITKGNAYNLYSRAFVEFVLEDNIARALLAWSADTYSPDEHYWATLNNLFSNPFLNTPGGFKGATIIGWTVPNITASASGSGEIYVSEDAVKWLTIEDINAVSDTGAVHLRYTYVTQVFPIVVLTDGEFYLNDSLDYETTQSYTIVVTVEDMATPVGSGTATITVIVTDVNEATPQFGASEYSTCIEDGSEEDTTLTTVLATDQDTANTVTHGLTGGNTNLDFKIDVNTGEIQVKAANLDSSVTASYNLVVEAADDGSPMLTGTTTVLVTVGDCSTATTIAVSGMAIFLSMIVSVH